MTKESMDDVKTTNQEPEFNQANRYILIGIERSKEEIDKSSKKIYLCKRTETKRDVSDEIS